MTYTITVLSGKGGVGKSSITASLSILFNKEQDIVVIDADVDASNLNLIFNNDKPEKTKKLYASKKARIIKEKCKKCMICKNSCQFNSIDIDEDGYPVINKFFCEGCGTCKVVCPFDAIEIIDIHNSNLHKYTIKLKNQKPFPLYSAQLIMGESGSGKIVETLKEEASKENKSLTIIDAPAGISCPVIASLNQSNYVLFITEPSPSGLSDLKRAYLLARSFNPKMGIIINKHDLNKNYTEKISKFSEQQNIKLIGKIPFSKEFPKSLVQRKPIILSSKEIEAIFKEIYNNLKSHISD